MEERPFVLLLPGLEGTGDLYYKQYRLLSKDYNVAVMPYDNNGPQDFAHLLEQIERSLPDSQQPCILIGFSFGACLAMEAALQMPERFSQLVLINPASAFARRGQLKLIVDYLLPGVPDWALRLGSDLSLGWNARLREFSRQDMEFLRLVSRSVNPAHMIRRLRTLAGFDFRHERLERIKQPVLLLASPNDNVQDSAGEISILARSLKNSRRHILSSGGHECLQQSNFNLAYKIQTFQREFNQKVGA